MVNAILKLGNFIKKTEGSLMKMAIALKFGAVSLAAALAMTSSVAFGKNVREVASVAPQNGSIRQEINLSHLNFLEATVPYPASPVILRAGQI